MRFAHAATVALSLLLTPSCGSESRVVEGAIDTAPDSQDLTIPLTVSPASVSVDTGGHATVTVSMGGAGTTPWTLSASGLPSGVTGAFAKTTIIGGESVVLTLSATTKASGSASATITGTTAKGSVKTATLAVSVVQAGPTGGGSGGGTGGGTGGGSSGVGPTGGTVDLLHFATTGDTRPAACEDTAGYPTPIINSIVDAVQAKQAQFALDLGDHMYVCNNSLATATDQMNLYTKSTARFSNQWFMTMGNHECYKGPCLPGSANANYVAFMSALSPVSSLPYYSFNIHTRLGLATFVVIADNAWSSTQSAWLDSTLSTADSKATYTIIARHHPEGDTSVSTNAEAMAVVRKHKFALFLTGHNHSYTHQTTDGGRDVVIGIAGAPLLASGTFNGYAMVDQQANGQLQISVYNVAGNVVRDTFTVGPNQ
jgi:hypothetical protein